ncbi:MAG: S9 family peptidase [Gemmatimonadetes bacterium]|nr:S9 family peptidase [Gemmatimonadota bacterium]
MRTPTFACAASCALLLLAAGQLPAQTANDRLTLDLYLELEEVEDPQLSPDGKQIVYTRRWIDKLNDRWKTSLWIMNADGSRNRFLVDGSSPRWSPDGTRIAYLADGEPEGEQIFVRWMDAEGAVSQVTRLTETPSQLAWSPDSKSIGFRMLAPAEETWKVEEALERMRVRPKGAKWTREPRIVERLNYRRDRIGYFENGYYHVFVVPADGGTPRRVTWGDWDHSNPAWMPDGRTIVFNALRVKDGEYQWRESEIYAADLSTGAVRQLTNRKGPDQNPTVSPDGRFIAYTGYDWTDDSWVESKLYVMNADGSNPRLLTASLDRSAQGLQWAPNGNGVYFNAQSEGTQNLYFASLDGEVRQVTRGTHLLSVTDVSRSGVAVGTLTSFHKPRDVVTFALSKPEPRQITFVNDDLLVGRRLGDVEEVWYPSVDGYRIQGWIIKPPGFDPQKKYPLILTIHGGPHAMYGVGFNYAWQEHAANGYVVLYTNPRGSTGYGATFGNAIKNAYPGKDFDDLMAGVDTVVGRGYVDARNLFVYGCSGGGVLTAWIVGHTDRFAAASSNCPVINWFSFVGTTDGVSWYRNFAKLPWEDPSEHLRRSPLLYVGNVKTPTMLMTGVGDLRTPISQTEEFYQALKLRKVPTAMIRFNDEWHGTSSKPSNFLRTQLYLRSWFERYRRTEERPRAEGQ